MIGPQLKEMRKWTNPHRRKRTGKLTLKIPPAPFRKGGGKPSTIIPLLQRGARGDFHNPLTFLRSTPSSSCLPHQPETDPESSSSSGSSSGQQFEEAVKLVLEGFNRVEARIVVIGLQNYSRDAGAFGNRGSQHRNIL